MAGDMSVIWVSGKAEYFLREDWTGQIRLKRREKFGCAPSGKSHPVARISAATCGIEKI
jgi:hypothetical protein